MTLEEYDFTKLDTVSKKCIEYASDGNKAVRRTGEFYRLEQITGCSDLEGFYLRIIPMNGWNCYYCWSECGEYLVRLCQWHENTLIEKIKERLCQNAKYKGLDGFKRFVAEMEDAGAYVDNAKITAFALAGEQALAAHYAAYREAYLARQKEQECARREEEQRKEKAEELRRKQEDERKLAEAEKAIRNHSEVNNDTLERGCVIVRLFEKYGIDLPLRTKGWMAQRLSVVLYREDNSVSVYWKRENKKQTCADSIWGPLQKLCEKICEAG